MGRLSLSLRGLLRDRAVFLKRQNDMGRSSFTETLSSSNAGKNDHRIIHSSRNIRAYSVTAINHGDWNSPLLRHGGIYCCSGGQLEARLLDLLILCTIEAPCCLSVCPGEKDASVSDGNRCRFQVPGRDGIEVTALGGFLKVLPMHGAAGGLLWPVPTPSVMLLLSESATAIPFGLWEVESASWFWAGSVQSSVCWQVLGGGAVSSQEVRL